MLDVTLSPIAVDEIDRLRDLWLALHHQHRAVSPVPLVEDDEASWAARRKLYLEWLGAGTAFGLLAERDGVAGRLRGVLPVRRPRRHVPRRSDATATSTRSASPRRCEDTASARACSTRSTSSSSVAACTTCRISVLAGNERAQRLYERRGLRVAELVLFRFGRS